MYELHDACPCKIIEFQQLKHKSSQECSCVRRAALSDDIMFVNEYSLLTQVWARNSLSYSRLEYCKYLT